MAATSYFVGTSGWHYDHWRDLFYPESVSRKEWLTYYARYFDTVELNTTFYRLPPLGIPAQWKKSVPRSFRFAAKGSRFLTHVKKLRDAESGLERFFERIEGLGGKLGPIVFQLPPQWPKDEQRLEAFLEILPPHRRYAFEFRNTTWHSESVYRVLMKYQVAFCLFDLDGFQSPIRITAGFTYIRLHGPDGKYQGSYQEEVLRTWAEQIQSWRLPAAYVYFDNDQAASAVENAIHLRQLLG